jgi:hypothetical protein
MRRPAAELMLRAARIDVNSAVLPFGNRALTEAESVATLSQRHPGHRPIPPGDAREMIVTNILGQVNTQSGGYHTQAQLPHVGALVLISMRLARRFACPASASTCAALQGQGRCSR